ncbi:recombinase-like helix-turn-helix domain-containing protein [Pantoea sp. 1.19]|uniref:recombinase-like helix-turn-helix domain-containing protein n=1 Tax=Pantoea sp. 1.19 TaxID=1925589 RepID=UPI000948B789|nr:recombinase-like helix-turn-helix domain-containing protein [Pantoea sp. 1.19]
MNIIDDLNPCLPESWQFQPPREGGNGSIHQPGQYPNIIWQSRSRLPTAWETSLIASLEILFEQGIDELPTLVEALNQQRSFDSRGLPWTTASFQAFLQVNGH